MSSQWPQQGMTEPSGSALVGRGLGRGSLDAAHHLRAYAAVVAIVVAVAASAIAAAGG